MEVLVSECKKRKKKFQFNSRIFVEGGEKTDLYLRKFSSFLFFVIDEGTKSFSTMCSISVHAKSLFVTLWTLAHQVPMSMGFSRQEYSSGWPFPSPGDLPSPGIFSCIAGRFFTAEPAGKPIHS